MISMLRYNFVALELVALVFAIIAISTGLVFRFSRMILEIFSSSRIDVQVHGKK
jgi:hypothetical protein